MGHRQCEQAAGPLPSRAAAWQQLGGWSWKAPSQTPEWFGKPRQGQGVADRYDWLTPTLRLRLRLSLSLSPSPSPSPSPRPTPTPTLTQTQPPTLTRYDWRAPALHETEWAKQFGFSALAHRFALLNVSFVDQRADGHVGGAMAYHSDPLKAAAGRDCLHY